MQLREIKSYLFDIKEAIDAVSVHINNCKKYEDFAKNRTIYRAVERELEIISEAITKIKKLDISFQIQNSEKIIGLRNRIAHAYDNINHEIIWGIVVNHLPKLKTEIEELLKK